MRYAQIARCSLDWTLVSNERASGQAGIMTPNCRACAARVLLEDRIDDVEVAKSVPRINGTARTGCVPSEDTASNGNAGLFVDENSASATCRVVCKSAVTDTRCPAYEQAAAVTACTVPRECGVLQNDGGLGSPRVASATRNTTAETVSSVGHEAATVDMYRVNLLYSESTTISIGTTACIACLDTQTV
jgi:hypothetical protein